MVMQCRCGEQPWKWEPAQITGLQMVKGYWFKVAKRKVKKDPPFVCEKCGCKMGTGSMVVPPNKGDRLF
jgi:hypothetical protein